ncbi:MAG: beta-propeller domain-containing protein, partial [Candidatus Bathyarchaeota archaeon]|nr:beta-propeller domain-containing protein [Candidatus Bathyarchaeota archaeon]
EGDFAWYQGVKISLFDVSDVSRPRELAKFEIGDRGTDSPVLRDHRAFLFSRAKSLLVIPVLVAEIDPEVYSGEVPPDAHGDYVYQGAYVFHLSPSDGIRLRGRVTHLEGADDLLKSGYYFESRRSVKRALYIDDVLYTISDGMIKMNSLVDLEEINRVTLS